MVLTVTQFLQSCLSDFLIAFMVRGLLQITLSGRLPIKIKEVIARKFQKTRLPTNILSAKEALGKFGKSNQRRISIITLLKKC